MSSRAVTANVETVIEKIRVSSGPMRARSLLVTLFGDAIIPRGGQIWMGDLIRLAEPFGLSPRLVRTSVFRLAAEDWIVGVRAGRESCYRLTSGGTQRFAHAFRRVYDAPISRWNGEWTLLLLGAAERERGRDTALQRELNWAGFGEIAAGLFAHPDADPEIVGEIIERHGASGRVTLLRARDDEHYRRLGSPDALQRSWRIEDLAARYRAFIESFQPLHRALRLRRNELTPALAFVARTLMVHDFRRISLHDPRLPTSMLPAAWPGVAAYQIAAEVYRLLRTPSERHLRNTLMAEDDATNPAETLRHRFTQIASR